MPKTFFHDIEDNVISIAAFQENGDDELLAILNDKRQVCVFNFSTNEYYKDDILTDIDFIVGGEFLGIIAVSGSKMYIRSKKYTFYFQIPKIKLLI